MVTQKEREKVEKYLEGKLIVHYKFPALDISRGIDWDYEDKNNPGTFQVYLHSLDIIKSLMLIAHEGNERNLEKKARELIKDWYKNNKKLKKNKAWSEHPTSSRLNNIVYFIKKSDKFKLPPNYVKEILMTHCQYLYSESNYKFNNHGLMMDYALLNASELIEDNQSRTMFIDKALYRIRYSLRRDFTRKGVHLENSPEYHRMVLIIYKKILRKCKELGISIGKQENEILKMAEEFKNILIQPNQVYPLIGDTGEIKDIKVKKTYKNFFDIESGYSVYHNYNHNNPSESTMLTFKCGYFSKTHKHLDDLSIVLFLNGSELLVDSGKYSYNKKDSVRNYIISPEAHNTVYFPNSNQYELKNPIKEQDSLKLLNFKIKKNYKMSTGINKLYSNKNIFRINILTKDNLYIVVDRVVCNKEESIVQNFNINEKAKIEKINKLKFDIELDDKLFVVQSFERYDTNVDSNFKTGFVSRTFGEYNRNKRIEFTQFSKNATFITAIYSKEIEEHVGPIKLQNNKIVYTFRNEQTVVEI